MNDEEARLFAKNHAQMETIVDNCIRQSRGMTDDEKCLHELSWNAAQSILSIAKERSKVSEERIECVRQRHLTIRTGLITTTIGIAAIIGAYCYVCATVLNQ